MADTAAPATTQMQFRRSRRRAPSLDSTRAVEASENLEQRADVIRMVPGSPDPIPGCAARRVSSSPKQVESDCARPLRRADSDSVRRTCYGESPRRHPSIRLRHDLARNGECLLDAKIDRRARSRICRNRRCCVGI